jgi:hypothetical protein
MLKQNPDYYTEMNIRDKLKSVNDDIESMTIDKNNQWYNLSGFIYGLVKLGYEADFLLSHSPIEIILISSRVKEIEDAIAEEQLSRQQAQQ